ncbi:uncharacterized protein LOC123540021 [Mercenaria mercenaria]|uniref:uncharacterized protein LOC123540021 n=1 Tax=Mercenaria mercenaria TaxID=6596 RepID=UPI00234F9BBB|nr:uncharacterized protein LOC123540021 [Mercenaria mercenaria]
MDIHKLVFILLIVRLLLCCVDVALIRDHVKAQSIERRRSAYNIWTIHFVSPQLMYSMKNHSASGKEDIYSSGGNSLHHNTSQHEFDNWTILLTFNNEYFDFFQNWWWFFVRLDIPVKILVIAEDGDVFRKIMANYAEYAYVERSDLDIEEEMYFDTDARRKIAFSRISHILKYLENGINILYSDIDTVWLKNPFTYFTGSCDMWVQMEDETIYSTGFMAMLSNKKTFNFMQRWRQVLKYKLQDDRPVFNALLKYSHIRPCPLDENKFSSGPTYKRLTTSEREKAVVVHNTNFELAHVMKRERFKQWNLWNNESKAQDEDMEGLPREENVNDTRSEAAENLES